MSNHRTSALMVRYWWIADEEAVSLFGIIDKAAAVMYVFDMDKNSNIKSE